MAFDFPMEAEPQAPPKNGLSAHPGEGSNTLVLSAEEEHVVREEGRRAGVVVRIKSLKRSPDQAADLGTETLVAPVLAPPPQLQVKAPERVFVQTSIPLEEIDLPIANAEISEIPAPVEEVQELALVEEREEPALIEEEPALIQETPSEIEPVLVEEALPEVTPAPAPLIEAPLPKRSNPRPAAAEKAKPAPVEKTKSKRGRKSLKEVAAEADLLDIPADEVLFSKQYYTMGEVAEMFRVNQSLLRFWETEFSILQPRKNRKGDRYFRPVDIKNLHLIYHLLRQRKYTIEGAKEFLRKNKKAEQRFEAIQRLQQIKAFLLELKAQL